ncbi:hypothetical protein IH992_21735 [Candidatus Poribacteria bacterium]|nr:hypothetical protein [Candidatus Poribacteria bacterium]
MKSRFPNKQNLWLLVLSCGLLAMGLCPATTQLSEDEIKFFETKIRPVLAEHCYECHGKDPKNIESDLVLTTAEGIRKGGMFGPVVFPGEPDRSPLI